MRQRGAITFGPIVGVIVIAFALIGLFAVCNADNEPDDFGFGQVELASHERSRCYEGDCSDQEYDQWNSEQNNHNRRNRGAFSPGPFDDSPVDAFNGNVICLPGSTCYTDDRQNREEQGDGARSSRSS